MVGNILKGLVSGVLLFVFASWLWHLFETSHIQTMKVEKCEYAAGRSLKALSELVKNSWVSRKHHEVQVLSNGQCMFFQFYENPGALYFGAEVTSGYMIGVAMTTGELHQLADSIPPTCDFESMLNYLQERAKTNPAPVHEF